MIKFKMVTPPIYSGYVSMCNGLFWMRKNDAFVAVNHLGVEFFTDYSVIHVYPFDKNGVAMILYHDPVHKINFVNSKGQILFEHNSVDYMPSDKHNHCNCKSPSINNF
jgi:hypothetical protein